MPNIKGRQADFIAKHGSMEREHAEVETVAVVTKRWPCPTCGEPAPEGTRHSPCAATEVAKWTADREAAHAPNMASWGSGGGGNHVHHL